MKSNRFLRVCIAIAISVIVQIALFLVYKHVEDTAFLDYLAGAIGLGVLSLIVVVVEALPEEKFGDLPDDV